MDSDYQLFLERYLTVKDKFGDDVFGNPDLYPNPRKPADGITVEAPPGLLEATVTMDNVNIDGCQLFGKSLGAIFSLLKQSTFYLYVHPKYFVNKVFAHGMFFYMSYKITIGKEFSKQFLEYADIKDKNVSLVQPVQARNHGIHFGKSSSVWKIDLIGNDSISLGTGEIVFVSMNGDTRKPQPIKPLLPDIQEFPCLKNPPRFFPPEHDGSTLIFTCERTVLKKQIDQNGHANYKVYLYIVMSALKQAIDEGALRDTIKDTGFISLTEKISGIHFVFVGEADAGDVVDVQLWSPDSKQVHAKLYKTQGNTLIHYSSIQFDNIVKKILPN